MLDYQKDFIQYALDCGVLKFGQFQLKSGRNSPYFFNTGLFNTGAKLAQLGEFYCKALLQSAIEVDILYGPAYKGIPLVSAASIAYARLTGKDIPFVFNRKEAKDHGEGGLLVGAALQGKALILDDVITAGTSVRESVKIINSSGATPCGVLIALDRQERGQNQQSAIEDVTKNFNIPVISIISLDNIIKFLEQQQTYNKQLDIIRRYQQNYAI